MNKEIFKKFINYLKELEHKLSHKKLLLILILSLSLIWGAYLIKTFWLKNQQDIKNELVLENHANNDEDNSDEASDKEEISELDIEKQNQNSPEFDEGKEDFDEAQLPEDAEKLIQDIVKAALEIYELNNVQVLTYEIGPGDTFSHALSDFELSSNEDIKKLISKYPEITKLNIKDSIEIKIGDDESINCLKITKPNLHQIIYEKNEMGEFVKQEHKVEISYRDENLYTGVIKTNLQDALQDLDLSNSKQLVSNIQSAFEQQKINFNTLKKGDTFKLILQHKYVNEEKTSDTKLKLAVINTNNNVYYSILADNGGYYDQNANNSSKNEKKITIYELVTKKIPIRVKVPNKSGKGVLRCPTRRCFRVTSRFNPRRIHPISGRIRPHNGVDFGMPTGTPVLAGGDGVVIKVTYQAGGAGRYIVLSHGQGQYQTVYMHLSKPLVKQGQQVKKGQVIAKSGNTGGSTGSHLHYELRINGRPVDPLRYASKVELGATYATKMKEIKEKVPRISSEPITLTEEEKNKFFENFAELKKKL